ncbi:carboxymuconolactone decarboxylase family protein [Aquimarina sp. 2201CG14-23]|uniref:carboxymuconolactone decarboxylase family protein n=1 Tax=Aquimarina mycalae TaxID=3040073 RepID=UPI0024780ED0|nr:peroxidase-related enzyme [Aquimarina sp. 2201CG14-23]MDH7445950.1 peroxidase-related enzyme [Aquimarina sp. 2201CG14-23]
MSWIQEISFEKATGQLKRIYNRVKGPNNNIDNVLSIHSLRPHTLVGHMGLYKNVLHNSNNTLPKWYLETLGVYVSQLNQCSYCVDHHAAGLKRLLADDETFLKIITCVNSDQMGSFFKDQYLEGLRYAKKLTLSHHTITQSDIENLRNYHLTDGEILEINQVVSYFNYVNRTVVGLGVNTEGDIIGLSPHDSEDPDNWGHS